MTFTRQTIIDDITNKYKYHEPTENQIARYNTIREEFKRLAMLVTDLTPICPDQTVALRKLHDANMAVNLTIACNE
jgi:hypothetical protein